MTLATAAGIDAGKLFLDLAIAPAGQHVRLPNLATSFPAIIARLRRHGVRRVALEAIGPYAQGLIHALTAAAFDVAVVNPHRIRAFRAAEGLRAKTDKLDAQLIARFALVMIDGLRPLPDADQLALKALGTRRRQLTELAAMEKTRLAQTVEPLLADSHRRAIAALTAECAAIEAEINRRIAAQPTLARKTALLQSLPGIGARIATLLITDLPELGRLDRKAVASLAGLAPHPTQSGTSPGRASIAGGRPCLRTGLYMAALAAVRTKGSPFGPVYAHMRQAGKPAKVALIAIARQLITAANAMLKTNQPFNANHQRR